MNEQSQNFETLKQLLKLKRHEIPPPGYFNGFSDQVISRIRAGEAGGSATFMDRLEAEAPWAVGFLRVFETRPGVIGAFATSLCLLLVLVVVFAEQSDKAAKTLLPISEPAVQSAGSVAAVTAPPLMAAGASSGIVATTNPVASLQPTTTLFGQPANAGLFQSASFAPSGQ